MGVESSFYVLPDRSYLHPTATKVCELITRFRKAAFLCDPLSASFAPSAHACPSAFKALPDYEGFDWTIGSERGVGTLIELEKRLAQNEGADARLRWSTSDLAASGLKYPLSMIPSPDAYYDVEIHLSAETVYRASETIEPFDEPIHCDCGAVLEEIPVDDKIFFSARLPKQCSACHQPIDYSVLSMIFRDAWTGEETQAKGGVTYRFCVMIECGKMIPEQGATVLTEFRDIIEQCLDCNTRVVQDFH